MSPDTNLTDRKIAIVKHTYTPTGGAEQELLRYLVPRANRVVYVSHPFSDARDVPLNTTISFYERGEREREIRAPLLKGPGPLLFLKDVLFTLWYLFREKLKFDVYVGVDNLNAYTGLLLRKLGKVDRVVYYVIDYAPHRFSNRFGQSMYRFLDRRCCYGADAVWNVSASMEEARAQDGVKRVRCSPQIEVPLGNRFSEIHRIPYEKKDPNLIVFLGSLTREQGLDTMIEALPKIRQIVPQVRLRVVGGGPEAPSLKKLVDKKDLSDAVEFLGFIEDNSRAAELVAEGVIAVAPYSDEQGTYKRFADPGKVKIYLAAGLPVVISKIPPIASVIEKSEAGIAVNPGLDNLADAVISLLSSPDRIRQLSAKALELGKGFDWDTVFDRAFEETFTSWSEPERSRR